MEIQGWLEKLRAAYHNGDPAEIAALFTEDARYRQGPFGTRHVGRDAIRAHWTEVLSTQSEQRLWFREPVIAGERAAVEWWCAVYHPETGEPRSAAGMVQLWFDPSGLCAELHEYFHREPGFYLTETWEGGRP
ncbi:nuclear transport factor 2 family protein [Streptosporangiaceae bacterium NEAU-GS5]|nr:nuclear transport factor 2 family protein [Streptosporangiaceae bacterium NEAU-GS5]